MKQKIDNSPFSMIKNQENVLFFNKAAFLLCAKRNKGISLRDNHTYCSLPNKVICGKDDF